MDYSIEYFIEKFSTIPEEKWTVKQLEDSETGAHCALGHCGVTQKAFGNPYNYTEEGTALEKIFQTVPSIWNTGSYVPSTNDNGYGMGIGCTKTLPKERILITLLKAQEIRDAKNLAH